MIEPIYSPWGTVYHCKMLCYGAFEVQTARHGGVMIMRGLADEYLSKEAQAVGFIEGRYLCFEEDCDAPVAKRELLDKGIMKAPVNEYYKEGEYTEIINGSLKRWNPEYWKAREQRLQKEQKAKQKKSRSMEER